MKRNKPHLLLSKSHCLISSSLKAYQAIMPSKISMECSLPCVGLTLTMTNIKKNQIYLSQILIYQWPIHSQKKILNLTHIG